MGVLWLWSSYFFFLMCGPREDWKVFLCDCQCLGYGNVAFVQNAVRSGRLCFSLPEMVTMTNTWRCNPKRIPVLSVSPANYARIWGSALPASWSAKLLRKLRHDDDLFFFDCCNTSYKQIYFENVCCKQKWMNMIMALCMKSKYCLQSRKVYHFADTTLHVRRCRCSKNTMHSNLEIILWKKNINDAVYIWHFIL